MALLEIGGTYKQQGTTIEYASSFRLVAGGGIPTVEVPWNATQFGGVVTGDPAQEVRVRRIDANGNVKFEQVFTVGDFL